MKDSLLPAALLSCATFSCLTLPLAAYGSKTITIDFQKEQIFAGKLRDIATPYLGIAAAVSLGAGAAGLSMREWSNSSKRSSQIKSQLTQLKSELQLKEKQIEELQLTDAFLENSGLSNFLEPEKAGVSAIAPQAAIEVAAPAMPQQPRALPKIPVLRSESEIAQASEPARPVARPSEALPKIPVLKADAAPAKKEATPVMPNKNGGSQSNQGKAPVHAVTSFTKNPAGEARNGQSVASPVANQSATEVMSEISELQDQLQQMAARMEMLQSSLKEKAEAMPTYIPDSSGQLIEHLHRRLQLLESNWMQQRPAS